MKKVYIKGLKMPKGCYYCKFLKRCDSENKYLCGLNYESVENSIIERDKFCPLRGVEE